MAEGDPNMPTAPQEEKSTLTSSLDATANIATAPQSSSAAPALREDQIQNAVSFLSHPKVRGSPAASKRSFLEKKGLKAAEIEEAFRRVPDIPTASVPAGPSGLPVQAAAEPPRKPFPTGTAATLQQLQPQPIVQQAPTPQPIRWTQVVVGLGLVAALGYAVKEYALPKVTQWYKDWRHDSDKESAEQEAQKTAQLVASAIQAQTAEMQKTLGELKEAIGTLEKGKAAAVEAPPDTVTLAQLRSELRVLATSLNEFGSPAKSGTDPEEIRKLDEIKTMVATVAGQLSARPVTVTTPVQEPFRSPDRGAWSNGAHDMHGAPPLANGGSYNDPSEPAPLPQPPHPASYMEVLEMLEKGQTPPNIREDINDVPPNPSAPPPGARMKPRPKPWERTASENGAAASAFPAAANGAFPAHAGTPGTGPSAAFPPKTRVAVARKDAEQPPARAPWADGGPSFAQQVTLPPTPQAGGQGASAGDLPGGSGASSSGSPAADVWKPPAVPQPSLARSSPAPRAASPAASAARTASPAASAASTSGAGGSGADVAPAPALGEDAPEEVPVTEQPDQA
ncbi:probable peroxisomal membrane protein PEX14 at N-terminal half [Coccomyxa sp. Obi]|nr:probable peroxisomal membrane protein PEX14 at N-terminal half [Coccomyxa sp. Obi]